MRRPVLLLMVIALISACTAQATPPAGSDVTVSALWVGASPSSTQDAGIEPATIRASTTGPSGFSVDLETVQAQGAGPQWQAATAVAATVASLFSANDPRSIDLQYAVTGPIDGPSAGAILTVGSLAALLDDALDPTVTMTGTISPDGTIGPVGGVVEKIKAAAAAGFTTVLVPSGSRMQNQPDGTVKDVVDLGRGIGVAVVPVQDITEAYPRFTGQSVAPSAGPSAELAPSVRDLTAGMAQRLVDRLSTRLRATGGGLPASEQAMLESDVAGALAALAEGDAARAYGIAVLASRILERRLAALEAQRQIAEVGSGKTRSSIADAAQRSAKRAQVLLVNGADVGGLGVEQVASLPFALAPIAYAQGALTAVASGLNDSRDDDSIVAAAAELADQRFVVDVIGPDGLEVTRASSSRQSALVRAPAFLSGYTDFLLRGADATLEYLRTVSGTRPSTRPGNAAQAAAALEPLAHAAPSSVSDLSDEVLQLAYAVSYFLVSEDLVSRQSLALPPPGLEADGELRDDTALLAAIASGRRLALLYGSSLVEAGSGVDSALWSSAWGISQLQAEVAPSHATLAGLGALHEQWAAVLTCLMIRAARALDDGGAQDSRVPILRK